VAYISMAERKKIPRSLMGDPDNLKFPVRNQDEFDAAVHLVGRVPNAAAVKRRLKLIAKRQGYKLPDAWKDDDGD
jgi:hypothetical protein